jgi:hypothetical protein
MVNSRARAGWLGVLGFVVALAGGRPAAAQVTQTDAAKTPLPQPVSAAELSLVNDTYAWNANSLVSTDPLGAYLIPPVKYGDLYAPPSYPQFVTGDAINLSGLFKWRKEAIHPIKDAKTGPGYFSVQGGFTGQLLLMGGNCQAQFGWYNVTDPASKTPPLASEVYPFITGKPHDELNCVQADGVKRKADGFCPLAWDNRGPYDLSKIRWTPKTFSSGDISKDPRYKGSYVAFAMIGDPTICPQNKFSMYEHNQRNADNVPWVTTLIYQSTVDPGGFYMAFEDLPMSAADWRKRDNGGSGADGDFNDFVFYVSGLTDAACAGKTCPSGQSCQLGACVDRCLGVVCPGKDLCSNGACVPPTTGAGGSGGGLSAGGTSAAAGLAGMGEAGEAGVGGVFAGGAAGTDNDAGGAPSAGRMNDRGGATATGGAYAAGGTSTGGVMTGDATEKSSSCAYAALAPNARAWPVLGLLFGLGLMRRRCRAR